MYTQVHYICQDNVCICMYVYVCVCIYIRRDVFTCLHQVQEICIKMYVFTLGEIREYV